MRRLYTALFYGAVPLIVLRLWWRGRANPEYRRRIGERFGFYPDRVVTPGGVWIHSVSVGETESAAPLIRKLREHDPHLPVVVTTTTPTGSARCRALFGDTVAHCYLPYDLPGPVARFLAHFHPRLAIVLETEIWPNLFLSCSRASLPLVMVNARLSRRSVSGYRHLGSLIGQTLSAVRDIAAQTQDDADRFITLGADPRRVVVTGNIKFDLEIADDVIARGRGYRTTLLGERPVVIGASTHDGEEGHLLTLFGELRTYFPGLLLVLAPRHPERFAGVAELCRTAGYNTVLRSAQAACRADDDVFVLDSLGELRTFYAAADVAFVGGTLVPVGGHNVLEPAMVGLPVVFGPHIENFGAICRALVGAGGAIGADGPQAVAAALKRLLEDVPYRGRMGRLAQAFVRENRGALDRVLAILAPHLAPTVSAAPPVSEN